MNLSAQSFEVLHSLGYPIYVRRSLLEHNQALADTEAKIAQAKKYTKEKSKKLPSDLDQVRKRAEVVSAASRTVDNSSESVSLVKWPVYNLNLLGVSGHQLSLFSGTGRSLTEGKVLISRMLLRCGVSVAIDYGQEFRWPLFATKPIDQSLPVAKKALASLILKAQDKYRWQQLLIFGEDAVSCTLEDPYHQILGQQGSYLGIPTVVSLSIEEMLLEPQQRKIVWQHLQPVRNLYTTS